MNSANTPVIVILGMHRSGTSMIGGVLSRLGVDLGEDFPGKQDSNPLGHYEDGEFLNLNERILQAAGGSWDDPPPLERIQEEGGKFAAEINQLVSLRNQISLQSLWGWKDPRTSLTIGLYKQRIGEMRILWCRRDPEEVADSLWRRNGFDREKSLALTRLYNQRITDFLNANPACPVLELPYQEVRSSPRAWVRKIAEFLEIRPGPEELELAAAFILPAEEIHKQRISLRWKNRLSLPLRGLKKIWRLLGGGERR